METALALTALPSMDTPPRDDWNNGASETVSESVVLRLDQYRCLRRKAASVVDDPDDPFARVKKLKANWDGYGAHPPNRRAIEVTEQFWSSLARRHDLPVPLVMATSEGGVYLEWDTQNAVLVIEFGPDGVIDIFVETPDLDVDGPLKDYYDEFRQALLVL